ncbi:MAG: radical SAM protein, partial [Candidatus Odinarchaeia archaeon]
MKVRASLGSAIALKKIKARINTLPTTLYLLIPDGGKCNANCIFCPQSKSSHSKADLLSRVSWPSFKLEELFSNFKKDEFPFLKRICIQCLNVKNILNIA